MGPGWPDFDYQLAADPRLSFQRGKRQPRCTPSIPARRVPGMFGVRFLRPRRSLAAPRSNLALLGQKPDLLAQMVHQRPQRAVSRRCCDSCARTSFSPANAQLSTASAARLKIVVSRVRVPVSPLPESSANRRFRSPRKRARRGLIGLELPGRVVLGAVKRDARTGGLVSGAQRVRESPGSLTSGAASGAAGSPASSLVC